MKIYYKRMKTSGEIVAILVYNNFRPNITDPLTVEITEEEYQSLLVEIKAANQPEEPETDEISATEALDIIVGGKS